MPDGLQAKKDRKDSQLIIRIKGTDRDNFVALCEALDTSAAREIRRFIREFVQSHTDDVPRPDLSGQNTKEDLEVPQKKQKSKHMKKRK
jgi:hypothetical protein